jgi:hypothetical protein
MAARTSEPSHLGGRVLLLVTGSAGLGQGLAMNRVCGLHVVTLGASSGRRLLIVVRTVAVDAVAGMVHLHGGRLALLLQVAAPAVGRGVHHGWVVAGVGHGKRMAGRAIRPRFRSKALARLLHGMLDARLFIVARCTTLGQDLPNRITGELVALATRDLLVDNVHPVAAHFTCRLPLGMNVHTAAGGATRAGGRCRFRASRGEPEQQRCQEPCRGEMPSGGRHRGLHDSHGPPPVGQHPDSLAVWADAP